MIKTEVSLKDMCHKCPHIVEDFEALQMDGDIIYTLRCANRNICDYLIRYIKSKEVCDDICN